MQIRHLAYKQTNLEKLDIQRLYSEYFFHNITLRFSTCVFRFLHNRLGMCMKVQFAIWNRRVLIVQNL
jgi:hypothetical protein